MIRTLSTASSNASSSSAEHAPGLAASRSRRFTLNSLATRLSDSKRNLLEQIPHHQQQLTRFRKRAKSFLSSTLNEPFDGDDDDDLPSTDRRNSSTGVYTHCSFDVVVVSREKIDPSTRVANLGFGIDLDHQRG